MKFILSACMLCFCCLCSFANNVDAVQVVCNTEPKEYILIFRAENMENYQPTEEEMKQIIEQWGQWIGGIAAKGQLVKTNELGEEATVVYPDGKAEATPYISQNKLVGGYMIVRVTSLAEATKLANKCPILAVGGTVEIRSLKAH